MSDRPNIIVEELTVAQEHEGLRLDKFLSLVLPVYSRSFLARAINDGQVTVAGRVAKPRYPVRPADTIRLELPILPKESIAPEPIPLDIIYEDQHIIAVNKPPHMMVHPVRGHGLGTLANALLHHCKQQLSDINEPLRPGIVHRLDRDTSGVIIAAKTNAGHSGLAEQFRDRRVRKQYLAVVRGRMEHDSGEITLPIGRDPRTRARMRAPTPNGKPAATRYFVQDRLDAFTVVRVEPRTGRTHQIRVHLSALRHPVVADALYGGGDTLYPSDISGRKRPPDEQPLIERQALHAQAIEFRHPVTAAPMRLTADPPPDITALINALRASRA